LSILENPIVGGYSTLLLFESGCLGLVCIVSVWRCGSPLIQSLSDLASVAETSMGPANAALDVLDSELSLLQGDMRDVQNNDNPVKTDIESGDPLVGTLSSLVGEDNKPKVEEDGSRCLVIHTVSG